MDELLEQYPNALEQLEILKKDYLGVDSEEEVSYNINIENEEG
jgi:hypothetical protein